MGFELAQQRLSGQQTSVVAPDPIALWFETWSTPVIILNRQTLEVSDLNPAARAFLEASRTFHLSRGVLKASNAMHGEQLRAALKSAGSTPRVLAMRMEADWTLFRLETVGAAHAAFLIVSPGARCDVWADTAEVFGLTAAENRFARRLAGGETVAEISSSLQISIGTGRTHVRRIYQKMDVSSREELCARLAGFRLPF